MNVADRLLELDELTIQYRTSAGDVTAVTDASFGIGAGEYFGLVGESGCGKSTIAKAIMGGLDENGRVSSGEIRYDGEAIQDFSQEALNEKIRWKEISYIPQSAMNSLDPLLKIRSQALKLADIHTDMDEAAVEERLAEMFEIVGLNRSRMRDYPHQFSGGMQQRAIIALALFLDPRLIVADEPTTALDVIMQDQVFKYLDAVRAESSVSMLMITHDISLVFENCDEMAIMHSGQVAETGPVEDLYDNPRHPYSILLQRAFPDIEHPRRDLEVIEGAPPQTMGEVDFCTFADRCPWVVEECREHAPPSEPVDTGAGTHLASCFRADEVHELLDADSGREQDVPGRGD